MIYESVGSSRFYSRTYRGNARPRVAGCRSIFSLVGIPDHWASVRHQGSSVLFQELLYTAISAYHAALFYCGAHLVIRLPRLWSIFLVELNFWSEPVTFVWHTRSPRARVCSGPWRWRSIFICFGRPLCFCSIVAKFYSFAPRF